MLVSIVEYVPNFSTSHPKVVKAILKEIQQTDNTYVLDHTFDDYYNRLVVTFIGDETSVLKAVVASAVKAAKLINMNKHKGQHSRLGAVAVVPFIPIKNTSLTECGKDACEREPSCICLWLL